VDDPLAGRVKPGEVSNEIGSRLDWCWTLLAAAGDPDVKDKLLKGYDAILLATLLSWGAQLRSPSRRLKPAPLPRKPRRHRRQGSDADRPDDTFGFGLAWTQFRDSFLPAVQPRAATRGCDRDVLKHGDHTVGGSN
jgi:hypothetical protein